MVTTPTYSGGTLAIELGGTATGAFDQLAITGTAALDGTLDLSILAGYEPQHGDTFEILTAASITGEFATILGQDIPSGTLHVEYLPTSVVVHVERLLVNGSFENGPYPGCYLPLSPGSTDIVGWVTVIDSIDYIETCWEASEGIRSLDLNGTCGVGGIEQTIPTVLGETYAVTFDMAANTYSTGSIIKRMRVEAAGQSADFEFDRTGHSPWNMGWETHAWRFTALASETVLRFSSQDVDSPCWGPALDDVSVARVVCDDPMAGDIDCDGDVDLADHAAFAECMAGPGMFPAPAPPWSPYECLNAFDDDVDDDVDMHDFAVFQRRFGQ